MKLITALVATLIASFSASTALAGIDVSWDWKDKKRTLKVFYDFVDADKLGDKKMKDIMDEALKNWNDAKADTGWEFVSGGTAADHDIRVKVDPGLNRGGGAEVTGFDGKDRAGNISKLTMTFDPSPKSNDGTEFKWDVAGTDKKDTKNPVSSAKHELSHTIRLDHQGGIRSTTGKIKDPQGKVTDGDDVLTISADDKKEAKEASTAPIKLALVPGVPGNNAFASVPGFPQELPFPVITPDATLSIPGSAFLNGMTIGFSRTSITSMPSPFAVPDGIDRMVKGVLMSATGETAPPSLGGFFTLTIPYEDGVEGEGFLIELADPDYGSIDEATLRPFMYNPVAGAWTGLGGSFSLDMSADVLSMTLPAGMLNMFPDLSDPLSGMLFISISGATLVPEPGTLLLMGAGLAALTGFRRRLALRSSRLKQV